LKRASEALLPIRCHAIAFTSIHELGLELFNFPLLLGVRCQIELLNGCCNSGILIQLIEIHELLRMC
jgi:hypothetical protein